MRAVPAIAILGAAVATTPTRADMAVAEPARRCLPLING